MAERSENPIASEAAHWLSLRMDGVLGPAEQKAFDDWLEASPHHAVAYARVESTWERAQRLQATPALVENQSVLVGAKHRTLAFSAAAVLALGLGGLAAWFGAQPDAYRTEVGERKTISLSDGSWIELNTSTELRVDFSESARGVHLGGGEALFHVAKDPKRPFIVQAGNAAVRAVGTEFNVRFRDPQMIEVTVTEGLVTVDDHPRIRPQLDQSGAKPRPLGAGEALLVGPGAVAPLPVDAEAIEQRMAWRRDLIELRGETLEQAVAEFNRYRSSPVVIGDPRIASIRVGGTFGTNESAKFVAALRHGFGVHAVEGQGGTVYLVRAQ